ncbi:SDR family oxidoreductase [Pantoea sp. DY-5]|uniref:SDR family oxidoreductase n=1 Tax=Pantoea sp. DY-5 TaxID=2871488 RepID=UPI001C96C51E|nr:SDR family oxidoreductase [Pantoea sp. DY-5]MBY4840369.1 SDR family oxidoreductase [Pantoea sp. DY-5]
MNTILITGATGFLGGAVTVNLLKKSQQQHLLLLVRADSRDEGLKRVKNNLAKFAIEEFQLNQLTRENILIGDLAKPELFADDCRLNEVTHVLNCAAVASFGANPLIWKVNVEGTFAFASRMARVKGLKRFVHVGTAMSCAPEANSLVVESELYTLREQHVVEYTWSKATVERMMTEMLPNLPLVIARPSIVVGHSNCGCAPSPSIFWVFRMALTLGKFMCELNDRIDVVPVDYCADALELLLTAPNVERKIIHISAGENSSVTFAEIDIAMAKASGGHAVAEKYQKVNYRELAASKNSFSSLFGPCNERIVLRAMNLYGHFSKLNVVFSNEKLMELGMPPSSKFTDYLHHCVDSTRNATIAELMEVDFK